MVRPERLLALARTLNSRLVESINSPHAVRFLLGLGFRVGVVIDDDTITDFAEGFGEIGLGPGGVGFARNEERPRYEYVTFPFLGKMLANDKQRKRTRNALLNQRILLSRNLSDVFLSRVGHSY